jgi:predicted nucleotidyltransferase
MKQKILQKLKEIEQQKDVEILFAVESGSRAWDLLLRTATTISVLYTNTNPDYYLSLWEKTDVIEFMTEDDLDGSSWDLRKAVKLVAKSNAPLLEWLHSPIVYLENEDFASQMREIVAECFSPIAVLHYYLGTTKNFMEVCEMEE